MNLGFTKHKINDTRNNFGHVTLVNLLIKFQDINITMNFHTKEN